MVATIGWARSNFQSKTFELGEISTKSGTTKTPRYCYRRTACVTRTRGDVLNGKFSAHRGPFYGTMDLKTRKEGT